MEATVLELARSEIAREFSREDLAALAGLRRQSVTDLVLHLAMDRCRERVARLSRGTWEERARLKLAGQEVGDAV